METEQKIQRGWECPKVETRMTTSLYAQVINFKINLIKYQNQKRLESYVDDVHWSL